MSKFVSEHILASEFRCPCCGKLPPDFNRDGERGIEYTLLFAYFEEIRLGYGKAIPITSGYRCLKHQMDLYKRGKSPSPYSVHVFGLALDLVVPAGGIDRLVEIAQETVPELRIGWRGYKKNKIPHVHIDVGYLITPRWATQLRKGTRW